MANTEDGDLSPSGALPARVVGFYQRNEQAIALAAFAAGFLFDIFTFDRVDSWLSIAQQAAYLALISAILGQMFAAQGAPATDLALLPAPRRWYLQYRTAIAHFLFGSLLNLYVILYFKSSSLLVSSGFLVALIGLLVANELPRFKALGLAFKFALLALCWVSFAACLLPVLAGSIGVAVFLASLALGALPLVLLGVRLGRAQAPDARQRARRQVLVPAGCVLVVFLGLYFFRLIPPVPLAIPYMGVYHHVERKGDRYLLSHETPAWRIWHRGDQWFTARPGDRVFVYFRVFSPSRFADEVRMHWFLREEKGWTTQDSIPIRILGGREQGFRGYGFKSKYQPGEWKVQIETTDGREIGRIYFSLETAPEAQRAFSITSD